MNIKKYIALAAFMMAFPAHAQELSSAVYINQVEGLRGSTMSMSEIMGPMTAAAALIPTLPQNSRGNLGLVFQDGVNNVATIQQTGQRNVGLIRQIGYANSASIVQSGTGHRALVAQAGRNNFAMIRQRSR